MDRNVPAHVAVVPLKVALRKESVDRNIGVGTTRDSLGVALRKESVDRNMRQALNYLVFVAVALRKESVDRNSIFPGWWILLPGSLSARRAWIEIQLSVIL